MSLSERVEQFRTNPLLAHLGIDVVAVEPGATQFRLVVHDKLLRFGGFMHGGVCGVLIDTAVGSAVWSAAGGRDVVTVEIKLNFIRPAWQGETLEVTGRAVHVGRRTGVAEARVTTAGGELVCIGSGTCMILDELPRPLQSDAGTGRA